jgi:hypothetical protein
MPQPSITEFLLARVAEREQDAASIHCDDCPAMDYDYGGMPKGPCDCGEPERVAAWCAAIRAIVELHEQVPGEYKFRGRPALNPVDPRGCIVCHEFDGIIIGAGPCETVCLLARVDTDHPDFDQAWAK